MLIEKLFTKTVIKNDRNGSSIVDVCQPRNKGT